MSSETRHWMLLTINNKIIPLITETNVFGPTLREEN